MGGDFSAVAVIGAALVVAIGALITIADRRDRRRVQPVDEPTKPEPTTCANAHAQQAHRRENEL